MDCRLRQELFIKELPSIINRFSQRVLMDLSLVQNREVGPELQYRAPIQSISTMISSLGKPSFGDVDGIVWDENRDSGHKQFC